MPAHQPPPDPIPPGRHRRGPLGLLGPSLAVVLSWTTASANEEITVYRRDDPSGVAHFSDRFDDQAQALALRFDAPERFHEIDYIPDGDTIHLTNGDKVRLLGINTPEVAYRDRPGEPGGIEAQAFLRGLLRGKRVRLEVDREREDKYGRLLAHVFLADGTLVNAEVVRTGHGFSIPHPPNLDHLDAYRAAETSARARGLGVWSLAHYGIQPTAEAKRRINRFARLEGRVENIERTRSTIDLQLSGGLRAYYRRADQALFEAALGDPPGLRNRTLVVRGWVRKRRGRPVVRLLHPDAIERITPDVPRRR